MSLFATINTRSDFLAYVASDWGVFVTDHLYLGSNRQVPLGTYISDWDNNATNSVTFKGTAGRDVLLGGGGEYFDFFVATAGKDIYGVDYAPDTEDIVEAYVDYGAAPKGVVVDMNYHGSQTFTDESGVTRTESIVGKASDGFGGTDYFLETDAFGITGVSSIYGIFGSSHRDVMITGGGFETFYGGGGNDLLIGQSLRGGKGNDLLKSTDDGSFGGVLHGDEGNDVLRGADVEDYRLLGGKGNDRIIAGGGDDDYVGGEEGNDTVNGGTGNDFIDGGVGCDLLISGAGSDTINPDIEYFQSDFSNPNRITDRDRDVIRVTRGDLGDYNDVILSRAFEVGQDEIRFRDAVTGGKDYRLYTEAQSFNDVTGALFRSDDLAAMQNTILQIDQDNDGFGGATPDLTDYFLIIVDATPTEQSGYLLT